MAYTFNDLWAKLKTARDPYSGKPDGNVTRIVLLHGSIEEPSCIAVKHHSTDILRYYADGTIDVCTGWTSNSTRDRLSNYANANPYREILPAVNGRRPYPDAIMVLRGVVFNGLGGYLQIKPDGTINLESVQPAWADVITAPKRVTQVAKKAGQIASQVQIRAKLGMKFFGGGKHYDEWLVRQLDKSLEEIDYADCPADSKSAKKPMFYARMLGLTKKVQFKTLDELSRLEI